MKQMNKTNKQSTHDEIHIQGLNSQKRENDNQYEQWI